MRKVETLDAVVTAEVSALPDDMLAKLRRIGELIQAHGIERMREPHVREEDPKDAAERDRVGPGKGEGGSMTGSTLDELHQDWLKRPGYKAAYDALEEEFAIASALIAARARAGLTQEQVAERMHTTQTVIARLKSGRTKPSTRTLERFAEATGSRLRILFEPATAR